MFKKLFYTTLLTTSLCSFSGELIREATVIEVANTNNNGADFAIRLQGGSGPCVSATETPTTITFPESKKQSDDSYQQAFSIALAAVASGMKVRVHNFEDDSCAGANFISISR